MNVYTLLWNTSAKKKIKKLNYRGGDGKELKKETLSQLGTVTLESHDRLAKGSEVLLHG